jgi:1,4-dihydroxy-2-naphthoyl-CoA hydrolase
MRLWKRDLSVADIEERMADCMPGLLGIRILELGDAHLRAEMPVDARHAQPFGLLHGGASVVLSETLGSLASLLASPDGHRVVGIEVNANHMAAVPVGGTVTGECRALHVGRTTQVWQTEIRRADGRLACVSRLTCAVIAG